MRETIRILVAVDSGVDPDVVQTVLSIEPAVQIIGLAENLDTPWDSVAEESADLLVVACDGYSSRALAFVDASVKHNPDRPVVVLTDGSANGFVKRVFEAGADDLLAFPEGGVHQDGAADQIVFTLQKAIARRRGVGTAARSVRGSMICVLGPKGGIGKTLTTANLAVALAEDGNRVVVVDLDLQFGDVALALGLAPERTVYDLATSSGTLDVEKIEAYLSVHESGARVLLAPLRPDQASAVTVDFLRDVYALLRSSYDYVIVDTPPGFSPEVIASIDSSSDVCMVGMLDSLSLKNTKLGLETLGLMGYDPGQIRLVLNRADSRVGITRDDVTQIVGRPADVLVPSHREIARSVNEGRPIVSSSNRSEAARAFASLAKMYEGERENTRPAQRSRHSRRLLRRRA